MNSLKKTIDAVLKQASLQLKAAGVDAPRTDALVLLEKVLRRRREWVLAHPEQEIPATALSRFQPLLKRRVKREPLAYITGFKEFYGIKLRVTPDVMIPRPETEALVEYVVSNTAPHASVLDVGTGSGAIAIAVKSVRPDLSVMGTDVSPKVLSVAAHNSSRSKTNINFIHSNLVDSVDGQFDVVTANLPYVPTTRQLEPELSYEPQSALFSGNDGLDHYRRFISQITPKLLPYALVIIEHEPQQFYSLAELAHQNQLQMKSLTNFVSLLSK